MRLECEEGSMRNLEFLDGRLANVEGFCRWGFPFTSFWIRKYVSVLVFALGIPNTDVCKYHICY